MRLPVLLVLACLLAVAQPRDPASDPLQKGYEALRAGDDRAALHWLQQASQFAPDHAAVRKELGYLYFRLEDYERSVQMFEAAVRLDPADNHAALELAFAYQRAGENGRARELFQTIERQGDPESQQVSRRALRYFEKPPAGNPSSGERGAALLDQAYAALRTKDYDQAIRAFQQAIELAPAESSIRKELAYVYLKTGETAWARDVLEQVVRLDANDPRAALELAFLRHETGRIAEARDLFRSLITANDPAVSGSARSALERIDAEISRSITHWEEALAMDPLNRSVQLELADLYERYGEPTKAVEHYLAAWLVPSEKPRDEILPRLARAREAAGDAAGATGAWLLASRSSEPRIAETAKPHLPSRHPYASEFRRALELNPRDTALRRDLAYLQLEVGNAEEARVEFEIIIQQDPHDLLAAAQLAFLYLERNHPAEAVSLLERARQSTDDELSRKAGEALRRTQESRVRPHRDLGDRSLKKSYLKDARREFLRAYEINPDDFEAALKQGIISNLMQQDREAMRWFRLAAASPQPDVSEQAQRSFRNLAPQFQRFTTTLWTFPFFSTRYDDVFQYSQLKTEIRLGDVPIRPYLSLRFIGDLKQRTAEASPQFLSESSLIAAVGVRTPTVRGVTMWGEAGEALSYLGARPPGVPRAGPDYRGGMNWFRARGASLGGGRTGAFHELNFDGVYVSRFDNNWIAYWQFRPGYRLPAFGRWKAQLYWNFNLTADRNRAYWANFVEAGPGVRFRVAGESRPLDFSINLLRGVHLINDGNPRRPNYYDLRIGLWYSMAM